MTIYIIETPNKNIIVVVARTLQEAIELTRKQQNTISIAGYHLIASEEVGGKSKVVYSQEL